MRITKIRVAGTCYGRSNYVFVGIDTDEGISGVGECTLESRELTVIAAVHELQRILIGRDPRDIERNWQLAYRSAPWKGAALYTAMSGLEQAMWDILGKSCGLPVHRLLGGPVRESVRCYTWPGESGSPQRLVESLQDARERYGYDAFKFGVFPGRFTISQAQLRHADELVGAVRDALGPDVDLAVDASRRLYPGGAIQLARVLEPHNLLFLEEPCESGEGHEDALRRVRQATGMRLATGEHEFTGRRFWPLLKDQLVDVIQPDLCHVGGILEARKIAAQAETVGITVAPHNPNGPVGLAAAVQLAACTPNVEILETVHGRADFAERLVEVPMPVVDGRIAVPDRPGLGVTLDWEVVAAHPLQPKEFLSNPQVAV